MDKLESAKTSTLNIVSDYGNMVSVPFGLAYALDHGYVKEGDTIFLMEPQQGWRQYGWRWNFNDESSYFKLSIKSR